MKSIVFLNEWEFPNGNFLTKTRFSGFFDRLRAGFGVPDHTGTGPDLVDRQGLGTQIFRSLTFLAPFSDSLNYVRKHYGFCAFNAE